MMRMSKKSIIAIGVVMLMVVVAAAMLPAFIRARTTPAEIGCINNLRLIDSAKQQWALEQRKKASDTPTWEDIRPYIGRGSNGELPVCHHGGTYTIGPVGKPPTCSYPGDILP